jgi:hypothetical protein
VNKNLEGIKGCGFLKHTTIQIQFYPININIHPISLQIESKSQPRGVDHF